MTEGKDFKLKRVSTYARERGISTTAVYAQIKKGVLETENVDGVTFVKDKDYEEEQS